MTAANGWDLRCNNKKCRHVFPVRSVRSNKGIRCPACQKTSQYRIADFKPQKTTGLPTTRLGLGSEHLKEFDEKESQRPDEQIQNDKADSTSVTPKA